MENKNQYILLTRTTRLNVTALDSYNKMKRKKAGDTNFYTSELYTQWYISNDYINILKNYGFI